MPTATRSTLAACLLLFAGSAFAEDRPASGNRLVTVEVAILEHAGSLPDAPEQAADQLLKHFGELESRGELAAVTRVKLSTLENQQARVQVGEQAAVATGRTRIAGGRGFPETTSYSRENLGTLVSATCRVESEGVIVLELQLEKSNLAPAPQPSGDEKEFVPARTVLLTTAATLRLQDGQPQIVQSVQKTSKGEAGQTLIVVTASAADAGTKAGGTAGLNPENEQSLKIFPMRHADARAVARLLEALYPNAGLTIVADERVNSLIIRGTEDQLRGVEALAVHLDGQSP